MATSANSENWGVFVGIDEFEDESLSPLRCCVNDAKTLASQLTREEGLIPAGQAFVLTTDKSPGDDDFPLKNNVMRALKAVSEYATGDSLVVVHFSTHGFTGKDGHAYLMPHNGAADLPVDTAVAVTRVNQILAESKAQKKLLVVDACRNHPIADGRGDGHFGMTGAFAEALRAGRGQITLASCDEGEMSYEDLDSGHGVFTGALIRGLRGAAPPNAKGMITAATLLEYAADEAENWRRASRHRAGFRQTPWLFGRFSRDIPLAEAPEPKTKPKRITVEAPRAPAPPPEKPEKSHYTETAKGLNLEMAWIPAGEFQMGAPETEAQSMDRERPVHRVALDGFWMARYLMTQAQWEALMGENPSHFKESPRHPVECVSWNMATEFCKKLSEATGHNYTLPTEAQWEYACRAGTSTPFHTGPTISTAQANYNGDYVYGAGEKGVWRQKTTPVGSFDPNRFGLYDMHGNLLEWCRDWFGEDFYAKSPPRNPENTTPSEYRVLRGGSWCFYPGAGRSALRSWFNPDLTDLFIGFRVSRTLLDDAVHP